MWKSLGCLVLLAAGACLHTPEYDRAFTRDWAHSENKEREFQDRKERIAGKGGPLLGKKDGNRADIEMDEKGRPKLNLGKKRGLSADVDMHGGEPEVEVKYGFSW